MFPATPVVTAGADAGVMTVTSDAVLFCKFVFPLVETKAKFVTVAVALGETLTVKVIGGTPTLFAKLSDRVQVKVPRFTVHPVPDNAVAVSPAGKKLETVIVPVVVTIPTFVTEIV